MPQRLSRISLTGRCKGRARLRWRFGEFLVLVEETKRRLPKSSVGSDPALTLIEDFLEPDTNGKTSTG